MEKNENVFNSKVVDMVEFYNFAFDSFSFKNFEFQSDKFKLIFIG
jgi:hypothetical protein